MKLSVWTSADDPSENCVVCGWKTESWSSSSVVGFSRLTKNGFFSSSLKLSSLSQMWTLLSSKAPPRPLDVSAESWPEELTLLCWARCLCSGCLVSPMCRSVQSSLHSMPQTALSSLSVLSSEWKCFCLRVLLGLNWTGTWCFLKILFLRSRHCREWWYFSVGCCSPMCPNYSCPSFYSWVMYRNKRGLCQLWICQIRPEEAFWMRGETSSRNFYQSCRLLLST